MMPENEDMRAESLVAWWLENGNVTLDTILVKPKGIFGRSVGKDIARIEPSAISPGEPVIVHVNREGLYDMLPEGLFHQVKRKVRLTTEEAVAQTQQYKAEEKEARKFFLPLEQEFYRHKVATEQAELGAYMSSIRSDHVNAFILFWDLPGELLSYEQKNFMLALLPHLHRIAGDNDKIAMCLQILLGEKVSIRQSECAELIQDNTLGSMLGEIVLGVDSVLGAEELADEEGVEVVIGPIKLDDMHCYLDGGSQDRLLNRLYRYFFQAEDKIMTSIVLEKAAGNFSLTDDRYTSRLGFTTILT